MKIKEQDETLRKNYIQAYEVLIKDYELVKAKKHPKFRFAKELYEAHGTCPQNFLKYYNRYKQAGRTPESVLPGKRGPKYQSRRTSADIEKQVIAERAKGLNRFEIHIILKATLLEKTPSPSCIYLISKRHNMNRLTAEKKEAKQKIIKERAGQMAHVDCHYLPRNTVVGDSTRYFLVCVIDDYSRLAWAEVVKISNL